MGTSRRNHPAGSGVDTSLFGDSNTSKTAKNDSWVSVDAATIGYFVQVAQTCGVAVMFTTAQGGAALGILVFNGDDKVKKYFHEPQEMEDYLAATSIKLKASLPAEVRKRMEQ